MDVFSFNILIFNFRFIMASFSFSRGGRKGSEIRRRRKFREISEYGGIISWRNKVTYIDVTYRQL